MTTHLERALQLADELESARERNEDLEARLRAVLGADPTTVSRALAWVQRAEQAERLLLELQRWIDSNPSVHDLLPTGFPQRLMGQLKLVSILKRDQAALGEKPPDDEWWESWKGDQRFFIQPEG